MQQFTIRDIENLTGIKAHTLRIWEQRYEFFTPQRKESRHRIYDNDDLKKLLRISFLYHNGWKVSKIAAMSGQDITREVQETKVADEYASLFVTRLIEAALDFNADSFTTTLDDIVSKVGFEKAIVSVCYPYLQKLGLLWSTNRVIPAQEHFSSYLIQNRIIAETENLPPSGKKPEIVLVCPKGEFHELPLLFVNYLLKKNNWSTLYLGTNVQQKDLQQLSGLANVTHIYFHLITNFTGLFADDYIEQVCRLFAGKTIVVSGEGIMRLQRSFINLRLLKSDQQIYNFIERIT